MVVYVMELPLEILREIISKLPIKTFFTCKCVCKTFHDLISTTIPNNEMTNLIIQFNDQTTNLPKDCVHLIDARIDLTDKLLLVSRHPVYTIPKLGTSNWNKYSIVNACNGLIYFAVKSYSVQCSYLCNPITKEVVRFSEIDLSIVWTSSLWLGFSPVTAKYKFLRFAKFRNGPKPQVLEIGSNQYWKDVHWSRPFVYITTIHWDYSYASVNGIGYWLFPNHKNEFIVYFDFESETMGTIDAPPGFGEHRVMFRDRMDIGAVGDSLCLVDNAGNQHVDIWMRTNNERGDWVKKFSCQEKPKMFYGLSLRPLQVTSSGDILMALDNRNIVSYDVKRNSFRLINMHMAESSFNIVSFVPNLLPIKDILKGN